MPKNRISQAVAAARLLQKLERDSFQPIPDEWFTIESYAEDNKLGSTKARSDIKKLVKVGVVEVSSWPTKDMSGRTLNKTIYRIKE